MVAAKIILIFWALYFSLIFITNTLDALKHLKVLPSSWKYDSGNFNYIIKVTSLFKFPGWLQGFLFFCVIIIEGTAAFFFWKINLNFPGALNDTIYLPFTFGLILFAGFVLMDEVFISYAPEATHTGSL